MFKQMFMFEWRYFTKQPSFYITASIFFILSFMGPTAGMSAAGNVLKNGPFLIAFVMIFLGLFAMFLVVNFVGNTALRDHSTSMSEILYSKPINQMTYQLGKFLGSFTVVVLVFAFVPLGLIIGSFMPWVEHARMGPFDLNFYLKPFLYFSLPNLFIYSCLFYALGIRFKSLTSIYLAAVGLIIFNEFSENIFAAAEMRSIGALLDPFAFKTFDEITRYWTVFEKNNSTFILDGILLYNRLLWVSFSLFILVIFGRFSKPLNIKSEKFSKLKSILKPGSSKYELTKLSKLNNLITYKARTHSRWTQLLSRLKFEFKLVIFDPAFYILCFSTVILMLTVIFVPKGMFGNSYWPVTNQMVELARNALSVLSLIIITYYSAEVIWREQSANTTEIIDNLPLQSFDFWLSKLLAVWSVLIFLIIVISVVLISYQVGTGYLDIDIKQYLISLIYFTALPLMMKTVVAFFCHVISPNKYVGMFLFVLFILYGFVISPLGFSHSLFHFGESPDWFYSDINGYGGAVKAHTWYMVYWGSLTIILGILSYTLWQRGIQQRLLPRIKLLKNQLGRSGIYALSGAILIFVLSGSNIYRETVIKNDYFTFSTLNRFHADYEKRYEQFANDPIPTLTKINTAVDIYPSSQELEINADIVITNKTSQPISRFLVSIPGYNAILDNLKGYSPVDFTLEIDGGSMLPVDGPLNTHWFEFDQLMQPGETRIGNFKSKRNRSGIFERIASLRVLENGTFFQNSEVFPHFGFMTSERIVDSAQRAKFNLPILDRANDLDDAAFYQQSVGESILGLNDGLLEFETTVSTDADQIAIASGYLQNEWLDNGRRYFHYKMDAPIQNYFAFFSGEYERLNTSHNGIDISVYYHNQHGMNVERISQSIKDSLDYYSEAFGPYQHRQARVIEFPGPRDFGQDFPNTIAYSEQAGFIHDQRNPQDNDQVYWFIAHEMAHQWWGAQLEAANVQGGTVLSETLAQYSAFMLIKRKYGKERLANMLEFELDRYLQGRSREVIEELPLIKEENQAYLHYNKGSIVMMALADLLGEDRLNNALKNFLNNFRFSESTYPTTLDLLAYINLDTNVEEKQWIDRMFSEINLYDFEFIATEVEQIEDNQFEVTLTINAHLVQANGQGEETEVPLSEILEISLYGDESIYIGEHVINTGENVIKLLLDQQPTVARLDPYIKFIDRDVGNNTMLVNEIN